MTDLDHLLASFRERPTEDLLTIARSAEHTADARAAARRLLDERGVIVPEDVPLEPGPSDPRARERAFWQGKIGYLFFMLLVGIPLQFGVRHWFEAREKRRAAPAAEEARDPAEAETKAREARCAAGDAPSCRAAARAFRLGLGVPIDEERAAVLLDRACALGDVASCPGGKAP